LRFCQLFCEFERRLSPTMRQQHAAGHKTFVDYSGKLVPITRSGHGRGKHGGDLRCRAGCVQPDLCRGNLDADAAGLGLAPRVHMFRLYQGSPVALAQSGAQMRGQAFCDPASIRRLNNSEFGR
jgi:hypothetical protein